MAGAVVLVPKGRRGDAECVYGQVISEAAAQGAVGVGIYASKPHQQPPNISPHPPLSGVDAPDGGTEMGVFSLSLEEVQPLLDLARGRAVCMYICMYVCICVFMYACVCVCVCTCKYIHTLQTVCVYVNIYIISKITCIYT